MTNPKHNVGAAWRILLLLAAPLAFVAATSADAARTPPHVTNVTDTIVVQQADTAKGMNAAQREYLDMKKSETIQVMDAGDGNHILLATAAWQHNRNRVEHIYWVPRDISRYGRVNKEIRERRANPHAHLAGIPVRKVIHHTPDQSTPFYTIATSDNLVLDNGEAYDSHNDAHQGQPLHTVWEEHRISTDAGNWLRLLIDNQLSNLGYQGPTIPMETTRSANIKKPKKMNGATEEEWRNAVMPEER